MLDLARNVGGGGKISTPRKKNCEKLNKNYLCLELTDLARNMIINIQHIFVIETSFGDYVERKSHICWIININVIIVQTISMIILFSFSIHTTIPSIKTFRLVQGIVGH